MVTLTNNPWPSQEEYEFLCQLLHKQSRIHLGPEQNDLIGRQMQQRLKTTGLTTCQEYCELLESPEGHEELASFMDLVLTQKPSFFREAQHFQFLVHSALPQWVAADHRRDGDAFRVWSAGCSSGEEPYSAAIVLADFFGQHPEYRGQVIASDISAHALSRARKGIYRIDDVQLPQVEWLKRFFLKGVGAYQGQCRVKDDLKKTVAFHNTTLFQDDFPPAESVDVILCRNVLRQFDQESQEELVEKLSRTLVPGGYLLIGPSENLLGTASEFTKIFPGIYLSQTTTARPTAPHLTHA